ncbi:MAG: amidohydrolase family protein [Planctomycetaceae bacterium]|nr:amidohydrolase family protein [Planctomycetaceae bacterium]
MNKVGNQLNRRQLLSVAAASSTASLLIGKSALAENRDALKFGIIDTNISLFHWPFRRLPLDETNLLVKKLRSLGVVQAWAGSFEALLHRDVAGVNSRLAQQCQQHDELIPIGAINPNLPGWKNDLKQCIEMHNMPGIRIYPGYHGYQLNDPRFVELLKLATSAGRFVQIATAMEDTRTQHRLVHIQDVDLSPVVEVMQQVDFAKVQILNYRPALPLFEKLANTPGVYFDTARVESIDGVPKIVNNAPQGKILLGSHAPFLIPEAALVRVHESSILNEATLQAVLSDNAQQLIPIRPSVKATVNSKPNFHMGLPTPKKLEEYRIWDSYFTPSHSHPGRDGSSKLIADIERTQPVIKKAKFEKLCYFAHVGIGTTNDAELEKKLRSNPDTILKPLQKWPNLLLGMIQLNANDIPASLNALNRWLRDGPMLGVYFSGSGPGALTCNNPSIDPLIERIGELNGVIMQHTWFKTGSKQGPGLSTPSDLAKLAARFPKQKFLCAHAGGEWEKGIRAVRQAGNVLVETSGFDATAGLIEMAVRELGAKRVVFGSHLPSRSLGTELCKVTTANITEAEKRLILGENFRNLLQPIM